MVVVRDVFRLKFGKTREALAALKGIGQFIDGTAGQPVPRRILTDLVGPYYTVVLETTVANLAAFEEESRKVMADKNWRATYEQFTPLVESGYREVFTLVQ